jgi:hypothetical protein
MPHDALKEYCKQRMRTINAKKGIEARIALETISVLIAMPRPPTLLALQQALAMTSGFGLLHSNDTPYRRNKIVHATNGLLSIDKGDDEHSYMRFVHPTLTVFLGENERGKDPRLTHADSHMPSICLEYLRAKIFPAHCLEPDSYPFLAYVLEFWGDRMLVRRGQGMMTPR